MSSTCFYCHNGPTPTQGLVMGDNGRLRHVWADEHDDGPLSPPLCPPLPQGFGSCSGCGVVVPVICRSCASGTSRSSRGGPVNVMKPDASHARVAVVPSDGPGLTQRDLGSLWELGERSTRDLVTRLVETGALAVEEQLTAHGGKPTKRYRRVAP
jgi:hypothetical protein